MSGVLSKLFKGDKVIWITILILFLFSMLAVYSATGSLAWEYRHGDTTYYFFRHFKFLLLGLAIIYIFHRIPYMYFSKIAQILFIISIPLLIFTLIFGVTKNDAARWLMVPGIGIGFQTSDLAKIALIMYIARLLSQNQTSEKDRKEIFKQLIIAVVLICGFILPANFSTAALLFATAWLLMYIGRVDTKYLFRSIGVLLGIIVLVIAIGSITPGKGRIGTWKNRIENYISGNNGEGNFQANQAKIAVVTGGVLGKGPGNSTQRNFLPQPYSDFIYAIIIEEYGILGGLLVLALYLFLLYRAGVIVRKSKGTFAAFLAIGLTISLVLQALAHMAVSVNLLPVTGQPMPLISMGGTSLFFSSIALGIILSVSRANEKKLKPPKTVKN